MQSVGKKSLGSKYRSGDLLERELFIVSVTSFATYKVTICECCWWTENFCESKPSSLARCNMLGSVKTGIELSRMYG